MLPIIVALLACWLESLLPIHLIGSAVIAMFIGMFLNQFVRKTDVFATGLKFTSKKILKFAIILLGLSLNITTILHVGQMSLTLMVFTLLTCFGGGYFIGKALGLNWKLSNLISAGTGICGGSAIAAIAPTIDADDNDVAYAMSATFLFDMAMIVLFPIMGRALGMTDQAFGIWAGTAVSGTKTASKFLMVCALATIGLNTSFASMKKAGIRPMIHGFIISALVVIVALLVEMGMTIEQSHSSKQNCGFCLWIEEWRYVFARITQLMDDAILNFRLGKYSPNRRRESRQVIRAGNENVLHASFFSPLSTVAQYLALSFSPTHIPNTSFLRAQRTYPCSLFFHFLVTVFRGNSPIKSLVKRLCFRKKHDTILP